MCSSQYIYPERFGSDGASGSQCVPSIKLSFGFDTRRPSDRRSHIEPLTQLEWRTEIFPPSCLLLDVLQSSPSARGGEGAWAGHPTEISRTIHAGNRSPATASLDQRIALQPQVSFGVESSTKFSVHRFSVCNPGPIQSRVGSRHQCKDSGGSWWTESTGAYEESDGDMLFLVTFLYRKDHILTVRKCIGSFKAFRRVNFCVCTLMGMVQGEGTLVHRSSLFSVDRSEELPMWL